MKKLFFVILAMVAVLVSPSKAQTYEAWIANENLVAPNQYEFDIFLKGVGSPFDMYSIQVGITFPLSVRNAGKLSAATITGSSELPDAYAPGNPNVVTGINDTVQVCMFKIAGKVQSGSGTPISVKGVRVGRFRISTSDKSFKGNIAGTLKWNFNGEVPYYATKVQALIKGFPKDITIQKNHFIRGSQPPKSAKAAADSTRK